MQGGGSAFIGLGVEREYDEFPQRGSQAALATVESGYPVRRKVALSPHKQRPHRINRLLPLQGLLPLEVRGLINFLQHDSANRVLTPATLAVGKRKFAGGLSLFGGSR